MAVHPARQKCGLGGRLLAHVLGVCRDELRGRVIWCNARSGVVCYYAAHGFRSVGDEFIIEGIGSHVVMVRAL